MKTSTLAVAALAVALIGTACRKPESAAPAPDVPVASDAAPAPAAADPYAGWVEWKHPDGLFSVKFPGQYELQDIQGSDPASNMIPQAILVAMPNIFFAQGEAYHLAEGVAFDPAAAISGGKASMLASMEGRALSERKVTLAGIEGEEFTYQGVANGQPVWGTARIYVGGSPAAVYTVNAMRVAEADNPQAQAFLASLQIPAADAAATDPLPAEQAD